MRSWREHGGTAGAIGRAVIGAVDAAQAGDGMKFEQATAALASLPAEQTGLLLGAVVRSLLEDQHLDGIDSDDIRRVLTSCYRQASTWLAPGSVEIEPLVAVLSGALGIHEPGVTYQEILAPTGPAAVAASSEWSDPDIVGTDGPEVVRSLAPTTAQYAWHAPLLIADLLRPGHRSLLRSVDRAFDEIATEGTMEMP